MSSRLRIAVFVLVVHLLPLFLFFAAPPKSLAMQAPAKITVRTRVLPKEVVKSPPKPAAKPTPVAKPKPKPKEKKPSPSNKKKEIAKKIAKSLEKLEEKAPEIEKCTWEVPKTIAKVESVSVSTADVEKSFYTKNLFSFLSQSLQLPDYGKVKIRLVLSPKGKVVSMQVLESQSEKNEKYLKEMLPNLSFPLPEKGLLKEKEEEFILTFSNQL